VHNFQFSRIGFDQNTKIKPATSLQYVAPRPRWKWVWPCTLHKLRFIQRSCTRHL